MSDCKEDVLEMIDEALVILGKVAFCTCQYPEFGVGKCNYCKIFEGLTVARACIVASCWKLNVMRVNIAAAQEEIESKIKKLLED